MSSRALMAWLTALMCRMCAAQIIDDGMVTVEVEPVLAAADVVIPALLSGPGYWLDPKVPLHGFQAHFVLHTNWGDLDAESVELLALRVSEVPALQALYSESMTKALIRSGAEAAVKPLRALSQVAQRPNDVVRGLPGGVWRFFSEKIRRIATRVRRFGARINQRVSHEGSPYEDADSPVAANRSPSAKGDRWFGNISEEAGRLFKGELGYQTARRALAARLGVDPYSGNALLRDRLDALAWASTVGQLGMNQTMQLLDSVTSTALNASVTVNRLVLEQAPEDLRRRNDELLRVHCHDASQRYQFLNFSRLSPTLQTELVDRIVAMRPTSGCEALLDVALMAQNEVEARFVVNTLKLLQAYLHERAVGGHFVVLGAVLSYDTQEGERVWPLSVDGLSWTADVERWLALQTVWQHPWRTLVVSGQLSVLAQRVLTQNGWNLVTGIPYPSALPYARLWEQTPVP